MLADKVYSFLLLLCSVLSFSEPCKCLLSFRARWYLIGFYDARNFNGTNCLVNSFASSEYLCIWLLLGFSDFPFIFYSHFLSLRFMSTLCFLPFSVLFIAHAAAFCPFFCCCYVWGTSSSSTDDLLIVQLISTSWFVFVSLFHYPFLFLFYSILSPFNLFTIHNVNTFLILVIAASLKLINEVNMLLQFLG